MSDLIFVGGGPRTTGILLRLAANLAAPRAPRAALRSIDVIDPYPAGGGRIWREKQSGLLWMNSMAKDVSIFADASVRMDGPVLPGPTLAQWTLGEGRPAVLAAGLARELEGFGPETFPSRRLQSLYLGWAFRRAQRALADLPRPVTVTVHRDRAVALAQEGPAQRVRLSGGDELTAPTVVLAQGHLDVTPTPAPAAVAPAPDAGGALAEGLVYVPPGFTADLDLSVIPAGEPAIVRGFGLAFIDAMILLTEGRGGRFVHRGDELCYEPSGEEPELWVGSGRGVPLLPKIGYTLDLPLPEPHYLDPASLSRLAAGGELTYRAHLLPLLEWNLAHAHYRQLWNSDPGRTRIVGVTWEEFSARLRARAPGALGALAERPAPGEPFSLFLARCVPDPADRFDFAVLNSPLRGRVFPSSPALERATANIIRARLDRAANPHFSSDYAVFLALLSFYVRVRELADAGAFPALEVRAGIDGEFHRLFSYIASGPPPHRLEQLLALHRAGIVRFLGPELAITADADGYHASSPAAPGHVLRSTTLVDAFLADNSAGNVADQLLQGLLAEGEVSLDQDPGSSAGGKFRTDRAARVRRADGTVHPDRYLLGPMVSGGGAGSHEAPFARPGTKAGGFARADELARRLLRSHVSCET